MITPDTAEPCPVKPMGVSRGEDGNQQLCFYLDHAGRMAIIPTGSHSRAALQTLFGSQAAWLRAAFPHYTRPLRLLPPILSGFDHAQAARYLIEACCAAGLYGAEPA